MMPAVPAAATSVSRINLILPPGAFRFLLAAAVVLSHTSRADVGRLAVLLFFYLSGYWTARIWKEKFAAGSIGRFYAARYLRVVPLYLVVMLAAAALRGRELGLENFTLFGVATTGRDPTGVSWSLDVELQFYLLLPLIFAILAAVPAWVSVAGSVALAVIGQWLSDQHGVVTVAKYLPAFVLGSLTFVKSWEPGPRSAHLSLLGFVGMTVVTAFTPFLDKRTPDPFDQDIWGLIWMLPLAPYVAHSLTIRSSRLDRHLGNLSFPLYLVHYVVIVLVSQHLAQGLVGKALAIGISLLLTLALYIAFDRPVDRWRVRMTETRRS